MYTWSSCFVGWPTGFPSTSTVSPGITFVPNSGTAPLSVMRPCSSSLSAARREQCPTSLRYLLMRIPEDPSPMPQRW